MKTASWLRIIFFVLLFISGLVWWVWPKPPQATIAATPSGNLLSRAPKASYGALKSTPFRGFIKGGVRSLQDFSDALYADRDLAHLFAGFDFSSAVFETLARPQCFYIAYRSGPRTFAWTKECKVLPKGTLILTDGKYLLRAACGNMLSIGPQAPVIPQDLEPTTLDVPDVVPAPETPYPPTGLTAVPIQGPISTQTTPIAVPVTPIGVTPPKHIADPPVTPYNPMPPILVCCGVPIGLPGSPTNPVHVPDIGGWSAMFLSALFLFLMIVVFNWGRL
jgi:hypothetical protein